MSEFLIKVPQALEVGSRTVTVTYDPLILEKEGVHGQSIYRNQEIVVGYHQVAPLRDLTFWHEILHMVNHCYLDGKLTESEIDAMGEGTFQVLKQLGIRFDWSERS